MKFVILDTSAIVFAVSKKIDLLHRVGYAVPGGRLVLFTGVVEELNRLGKSGRKNAKYARYALKLIKDRAIATTQSYGHVDDWIVKSARPGKSIVCTNDIALKRRLRTRGIRVIGVSSKGVLR